MKTTIEVSKNLEGLARQMQERDYDISKQELLEALEVGYFYSYKDGYQDADCFNIALENGEYIITVGH